MPEHELKPGQIYNVTSDSIKGPIKKIRFKIKGTMNDITDPAHIGTRYSIEILTTVTGLKIDNPYIVSYDPDVKRFNKNPFIIWFDDMDWYSNHDFSSITTEQVSGGARKIRKRRQSRKKRLRRKQSRRKQSKKRRIRN
jgi:PKD repeat protein